MLYKDNKAYAGNVNGATVPFLPVYASQNGDRLNERKGKSLKLAKLYYKRSEELQGNEAEAMKKRASRVYGCCSMRELAISDQGYAMNLYSHRCKDRHCVECQRVRAFILQQKIREITPDLINQTNSKDGLIFGTLTIKNPPIKELKAYLNILSKSFARLIKRKNFKQICVGGFRCFEITRGEAGSDFCHPHIHFLLQVKASYFARNSPYYINADKWAEAWTDCLRLETAKAGKVFNIEDYPNGKAFVKILRVQAPNYTRENRKYATIETLQTEGDQVINYVLKYTAKEDENSKKALVKNDPWFFEYDKNIKSIRAIAFFGIYKTLIAELKPNEYDEEKIKTDLNNNNVKYFSAIYDDDHKYVLIKTTEAEALQKKRFNMVKSAFNTLKTQIESKIKILDIIEQSIKKRDIFKTQEEIENINILSERIFKTFKRLEKLGEVKEEKNGFNQHFHNYNFSNEIYRPISDVLNTEKIAEIERIRREILWAVEIVNFEDNPIF